MEIKRGKVFFILGIVLGVLALMGLDSKIIVSGDTDTTLGSISSTITYQSRVMATINPAMIARLIITNQRR